MATFSDFPVYSGNDLGLTVSGAEFSFRFWSPVAVEAEIIFYSEGAGGYEIKRHMFLKDEGGTWIFRTSKIYVGCYYVYRVRINEAWSAEVVDPYAKFVGINGLRALVADKHNVVPDDWSGDEASFDIINGERKMVCPTDAVIYEIHVRDMTVHQSSGVKQKGKYKGLTEKDTVNPEGISTGLAHLVQLGITHVQILPVFDFSTVDEAAVIPEYNWGYDPLNYFTPEGSYASDAYDGRTRVRELKELIHSMHKNGIGVIIDIAFNHTSRTKESAFNQLVPGYYYRHKVDGSFSDATGCGNETASERPMMRKFMIDCLRYWVEFYHVDGFRIDLMGVHDTETMNVISRELYSIRNDLLIYGEGWVAKPGDSPLPDTQRALKKNAFQLNRIAVFSDDLRDGIRGSVFRNEEKGFVSGRPGLEETIRFGIAAACFHPQINYGKINYSDAPYSAEPFQTVNYADCHDNLNLYDKILYSCKEHSADDRANMQRLAMAIVLTSQGIPFLHAGSEFLRTKFGIENSYASGDPINAIDWKFKSKNIKVFEFVKNLIALRKAHPVFRLSSALLIQEELQFLQSPPGVVVYTINGIKVNDSWKRVLVILNGSEKTKTIGISNEAWNTAIVNNEFIQLPYTETHVRVNAFCCVILYQQ